MEPQEIKKRNEVLLVSPSFVSLVLTGFLEKATKEGVFLYDQYLALFFFFFISQFSCSSQVNNNRLLKSVFPFVPLLTFYFCFLSKTGTFCFA